MVIITEKITSYNVVFDNKGFEVTIKQDCLQGGYTYEVLDDTGAELDEEDSLKLEICEYVESTDVTNPNGFLTNNDILNSGGSIHENGEEDYNILTDEEDEE